MFSISYAKGMDYLQETGLIHRDLKSANVLVSEGWTMKGIRAQAFSDSLPQRTHFDVQWLTLAYRSLSEMKLHQ